MLLELHCRGFESHRLHWERRIGVLLLGAVAQWQSLKFHQILVAMVRVCNQSKIVVLNADGTTLVTATRGRGFKSRNLLES